MPKCPFMFEKKWKSDGDIVIKYTLNDSEIQDNCCQMETIDQYFYVICQNVWWWGCWYVFNIFIGFCFRDEYSFWKRQNQLSIISKMILFHFIHNTDIESDSTLEWQNENWGTMGKP